MTKEEYEQVYADGFRAGWKEAVRTLQNLEPPALNIATGTKVDTMAGTGTVTPTVTVTLDPNIKNLTDHTLVV